MNQQNTRSSNSRHYNRQNPDNRKCKVLSEDSIKVTISNKINKEPHATVMDERESKRIDDDGVDESFLLKIIFSNNNKYAELKADVFNSIKQGFIGKNLIMKDSDDDNTIEVFEINDGGNVQSDLDSNKAELDESDLFTIDTKPETNSKDAKISNVIQIPVYRKDKFANVLLMAEDANTNTDSKVKSSGKNCFNCGESHNLKDCRKPRNHQKIQQRMRVVNGGDRYHIEPNQKYANVVPGKLSETVRNALGLKKNEIPSHVYRMRVFGYPPGWLEDHKISNSGLNLFGSDGKAVENVDEYHEQGEIVEREQYDLNKIIEFPGFNAPLRSAEQYDNYQRNRVPPLSENQSKEAMISFLRDKLVTPYKRKKLLNFPGANIQSDDNNIEEQCMEIEDDNEFCGPMPPKDMQPPLPEEETSYPIPPPPPPPDNTISSDSVESGEVLSDDDDNDDEKKSKKVKTSTSLTETLIPSKSSPIESVNNVTELNKNVVQVVETSEIMNSSHTKFETNGTPLLQFSPYTSLPTGDKFSVGVCDVINFENLPDSTGKYETMKGILKRVRNQMEQMHNNDL